MSARDPDTLQTEPKPRADAHSRCPAAHHARPPCPLADAPMRPRAAQKPLDIGLFDDARNQLEPF
ncbi:MULTISPECIES: hypothetical protein [Mesorhizobium]|uniref:Uncharacterized protein n=2 Tax=Mesorhizobium TaxID=68287 RepID=A0ABZ0VN39_9HYPH|nr:MULTISPECIES: hypothetical protein [Mesorhizobium]MBZ9910176.1 hypothetical protein [Mesorhizobium sp. BR115XR7A]QJF04725.1 hypothetical protein R7A2020_29525 [Mesorhizobium japonicum R7A]QJF10794.1 hypothetical protein HID05_29515 [Mesorhizobium japonicum]QJI86667.1 hypothetical protein HKB46_29525 [Mesorhizobium japonicum]WQB97006.1 hypothetical protein U0R22_001110 [Mesorhizobium huakuii]